MEKSYRIIHRDTGKFRLVGKHIYDNLVLLDQMGYIQQNIPEVILEEKEELPSDIAQVELPKRGRKPKEKQDGN